MAKGLEPGVEVWCAFWTRPLNPRPERRLPGKANLKESKYKTEGGARKGGERNAEQRLGWSERSGMRDVGRGKRDI